MNFKAFRDLHKQRTNIFIFLFTALFAVNISALSVPSPKGYVSDYAGLLNANQTREISSYLESLDDTTGVQMAVLIIPSLRGDDLEVFSMNVAEKWQIGQEKEDNGALLVIALNDRKIRIETGYGLEEKLTDAKCGLIIRNIIIPEFRNGNYAAGIYKAVRNMGGIATDNAELISKKVLNQESDNEEDFAGIIIGIVFLVGWLMLISSLAKSRNRGLLSWILLDALFSSAGRRHRGSYYGGFNGFGGSSGLGSGGHGFSGGGGHFGGGGASGGW